jgi:hypothetical protein
MKTVASNEFVRSLPPTHVAILFEGAWFFTQDPDHQGRILAICPYTNAPDHVCECGLWKTNPEGQGNFVGLNWHGHPGLVREGDKFWADVVSSRESTNTFTDLFSKAAKDYNCVYLVNPTAGSLQINSSNPLFRRISVPVPDCLRLAGKMTTAPVQEVPSNSASCLKNPSYTTRGKDQIATAYPYVDFILVYEYSDEAELIVSSDTFVNAKIHTGDHHPNPHLIFRVHSVVATDTDGCQLDDSAEICHMVGTFDTVRKLAVVPPATVSDGSKGSTTSAARHIDIAVYPQVGPLRCDPGDTGLTCAELGIPDPGTNEPPAHGHEHPFILTYASCASGGGGGDGGN